MLLNDHWTTADSLPTPCKNMRATFHEGNFYFTGGEYKRKGLFTCSLESLIASWERARSIWREITTSIYTYTIVSYSSNLIGMDRYSTIRGYSKGMTYQSVNTIICEILLLLLCSDSLFTRQPVPIQCPVQTRGSGGHSDCVCPGQQSLSTSTIYWSRTTRP